MSGCECGQCGMRLDKVVKCKMSVIRPLAGESGTVSKSPLLRRTGHTYRPTAGPDDGFSSILFRFPSQEAVPTL